ncbi:hypothetical protein V8C44DRAFT_98861 [Trichoderma aethiopicum]
MIARARAYLQGHRARTCPHPVVTGRQRLEHGSAVEIVASASPTRASLRDDSGPACFGFTGAKYRPEALIECTSPCFKELLLPMMRGIQAMVPIRLISQFLHGLSLAPGRQTHATASTAGSTEPSSAGVVVEASK